MADIFYSMDHYRLLLGRTVLELPWWWLDALLAWSGLIGLVLWLFGRHLIRPFFGILGLIDGGIFGLLLATRVFTSYPVMLFVIAGAVLGAVTAWSMYRLGMGVVLAVTTAVVAPIVVVSVMGAPQPALGEPIKHAISEIAAATSIPEDATTNENGQTVLKPGSAPPLMTDSVNKAIDDVRSAFSDWWSKLPGSVSSIVLAAVVIGAINGVVLGTMVPGLASAFVASLLGVLLMAGGIQRLFGSSLKSFTPDSPQGTMIMLGVLVVIGAGLQLTVFRRSSN
jgi:hypothetical protein